jgi:polysaccharide pyruvyl transferase CsaB
LSSILSSIKKQSPNAEFTILSLNPVETSELYSVNAVFRPDFGPKWFQTDFKKMWNAIKSSDLVIIGGGGLLEDTHNYFSIPRYLHTVILAKLFRKPVMFYSVGVGPISNKLSKFMVQSICNISDIITVRDQKSKEILDLLGVSNVPILVSEDPVFLLEAVDSSLAKKILLREKVPLDKPLIGVSVRQIEWCNPNYSNLAKFLDYLITSLDVTVVFVPFGRDGSPTDLDLSRQVMKHNAYVLEEVYSPSEILGIIKQFDFLIGMRFHSLMMGATTSVPILGICYLPKVEILLTKLGYNGHHYVKGDFSDLTYEDLLEKFKLISVDKEKIMSTHKEALSAIKYKALKPSLMINKIENKNVPKIKLIALINLFFFEIILFGFFQIVRSYKHRRRSSTIC